jgi:L-lactate dehydrogenase complex protein LldG
VKDEHHVLEKVRRALGRAPGEPRLVPVPPPLPEAVVRLAPRDTDLPALFEKRAAELKMIVTRAAASDLAEKLVAFLRTTPVKSVAVSVSPLLERLGVRAALESAGLTVKSWDELTLDQMYEFDCAVTDVNYAVAESGTLVIKPSARQGRSMSLVPMYHVAVVEPSQFLADMVDLFDVLNRDPARGNFILISGPSKTADIEMNVVTGVHGPNVVNAFILQ